MEILTIMAGIEAAIAAAPKVIAVAQKGKELISELFNAGAISAEKQNALHERVDVVMNAYLAGEVPPALQVEPDPVAETAPEAAPKPAEETGSTTAGGPS